MFSECLVFFLLLQFDQSLDIYRNYRPEEQGRNFSGEKDVIFGRLLPMSSLCFKNVELQVSPTERNLADHLLFTIFWHELCNESIKFFILFLREGRVRRGWVGLDTLDRELMVDVSCNLGSKAYLLFFSALPRPSLSGLLLRFLCRDLSGNSLFSGDWLWLLSGSLS